MHPKITEIAQALREYFVYQQDSTTEFSIFLCGAARSNPGSIREEVRSNIESRKSKYTYRVHYPEDLFVELLLGHQRKSLLELENLLATSVSSVAVITESPGALVELGAFSNHAELCKKLIVFLKEAYRTDKSFINLGPVRGLKKSATSSVHYVKFEKSEAVKIAERICEETRRISSALPAAKELTNPITAARFYLALVYTFDPIPIQQILNIVSLLSNSDPQIDSVATLVLNTLIAEGKITSSAHGIRTTSAALEDLLNHNLTQKRFSETRAFLSEMRSKALNVVLKYPLK
jgi:hypothetical protein